MSQLSTKSFVILTSLFVVAVGTVLFGMKNGWFDSADTVVSENIAADSRTNANGQPTVASLAEALNVGEEDLTVIGGIKREKRDVGFNSVGNKKTRPDYSKMQFRSPGESPRLKGNENPQVSGLLAELKQENKPLAAVTSYVKPEPFDREEYDKNPRDYLDKVRPGRIFDTAKPGPGVTPLVRASQNMFTVLQGEKVVLKVNAEPGSPVTFYTGQVGEFDNRLSTYTTQANEEGIASTTYHATSGTRGLIEIAAASPVHTGQLQFFVRVSLPN